MGLSNKPPGHLPETVQGVKGDRLRRTRNRRIEGVNKLIPEPQLSAWPTVPVISAESLPAAEAIARIAIELRGAQKSIMEPSWDSYLNQALELLKKAEMIASRPATEGEFLSASDGSPETVVALLAHRDLTSPRRVPFRKVVDPKRKAQDHEPIPIPLRGGTKKVDWRVFTGDEANRNFEKFFWRYTEWISKQPPAPTGLHRQKVVPAAARQNWNSILEQWKSEGIPWIDFVRLDEFRRGSHSAKFAKKQSRRAQGRKKRSHAARRAAPS